MGALLLWIQHDVARQESSLLRGTLRALASLPLPLSVATRGPLRKAVASLQKYRHPKVPSHNG